MTVAELIAALTAIPGDHDLLTVDIACVESEVVPIAAVVRVFGCVEIRGDSLLAPVVMVKETARLREKIH